MSREPERSSCIPSDKLHIAADHFAGLVACVHLGPRPVMRVLCYLTMPADPLHLPGSHCRDHLARDNMLMVSSRAAEVYSHRFEPATLLLGHDANPTRLTRPHRGLTRPPHTMRGILNSPPLRICIAANHARSFPAIPLTLCHSAGRCSTITTALPKEPIRFTYLASTKSLMWF